MTDDDDRPSPSLPAVAGPGKVGLLVDLGRPRRKHIKRLKRGFGRLTAPIEATIESARQQFGIDPGREIVPVVLLYRYSDDAEVVSVVET